MLAKSKLFCEPSDIVCTTVHILCVRFLTLDLDSDSYAILVSFLLLLQAIGIYSKNKYKNYSIIMMADPKEYLCIKN